MHDDAPLDTPQPSAKSGMRFDELYRLKGVVSLYSILGIIPHRFLSFFVFTYQRCEARHRRFFYCPRRLPSIQLIVVIRCKVRESEEAVGRR